MKFVAISDTHGLHRRLVLPPADVIVHGGDVSRTGKQEEVNDFIDWFTKLDYKYKIFIAGNHDFYFEKISKTIQEKKLIPEGIIYLNDSGIEIEKIKIWGSPVQPWFYDWAFNRARGKQIREHWDLIPNDIDLLITHGPPYGILDTTITKQSAGCRDLLHTVFTNKPKVHVFGHIHESFGEKHEKNIHFINASVLNEEYRLTNNPVMFELETANQK